MPSDKKDAAAAQSSQNIPSSANEEGDVGSSEAGGIAGDRGSLPDELGNLQLREDGPSAATAPTQEEEEEVDDEEYSLLLGKLQKILNLKGAESAPSKKPEPLLETFNLAGVASLIQQGKTKNIICMCGAGISVSAGIPDFRSPKTGLYHNLKKYKLPHPQAVFELDYFRKRPEPFYQLAKELFPGNFRPTPTHYFMTLLHQKGLLLRCFTQNIDSLERQAGLPKDRIVAAHGNFDSAHCIRCGQEVPLQDVRAAVTAEKPCHCPKCRGLVKPDIVFFGENLPATFFKRAESDFPACDLLIVMGTSLVVNPFASLIDHVEEHVPRVLINRERVGEADPVLRRLGHSGGFDFERMHRDALHLGDCDAAVRQLAALLGWASELDELIGSTEQQAQS